MRKVPVPLQLIWALCLGFYLGLRRLIGHRYESRINLYLERFSGVSIRPLSLYTKSLDELSAPTAKHLPDRSRCNDCQSLALLPASCPLSKRVVFLDCQARGHGSCGPPAPCPFYRKALSMTFYILGFDLISCAVHHRPNYAASFMDFSGLALSEAVVASSLSDSSFQSPVMGVF